MRPFQPKLANRFVFFLVWLAAIAAAPAGCKPREPTMVLTYQVDRQAPDGNMPVDMDSLVLTLNDRLRDNGRARLIDQERINIEVFGDADEARLASLKRRIESQGRLEFRIIADAGIPQDGPVIAQARLLPPEQKEVMVDGKPAGRWVAYKEREFRPRQTQVPLVTRTADGRPEALVLLDSMNMTGEYLTSATRGGDAAMKTLELAFNQSGRRRMGTLTGENLPDPATGVVRHLGILWDDELFSAPSIRSRIDSRAAISGGSMTEREIEDLIAILHAGVLPARLREVE